MRDVFRSVLEQFLPLELVFSHRSLVVSVVAASLPLASKHKVS